MSKMMSACGVMCSECPAYGGAAKGLEHQRKVVEAWQRIYERPEKPGDISCGGCLGPDEIVFHTSVGCRARACCRSKGFGSCAECAEESCADLEEAQAVWDGVPEIGAKLSRADFVRYAQPYCGHRTRLAAARNQRRGG